MVNGTGHVGSSAFGGPFGTNNSVRVVDGAVWRNNALQVGYDRPSNSVVVAGGSVLAMNLTVGFASAGCDNFVQLDSGSVIVTNAAHNATLEVRWGKFILNGGTLQVDRFVMTNDCAQFVRTGGTLIYGTAVLTLTRDDDGDGIPNGWEQAYGFDPLNAADADADSDGDGFTNLQEFQAGTDPTNSASAFRIVGIAQEGDDMRVTWATAGGRTNVLQAANSLSGVYFNISANIVISGVGDVVTNHLDQGAARDRTCRFYRVALRATSIQDTNAPTLAITSPADNSLITNSTVTVTGTSADACGVSGVDVQGIAASSANGYGNWVAVVTGLGDGTNTLTVLAGDNAAPANIATGSVRVICATGSFDGNGDGLADGWQIQYFGSVNAPDAAPAADPDGDGISNLQEFLDGTDPTLPAPAAPSNLTATAVSTNQINLSWTDNSTNEDGFAIERAPDGGGVPGTWTQITTVSSNATTYSDAGLLPNTTYWYRVRAYNAGGDSDYSNQTSAATPALCPRLVVGWGDNSNGQASPPAGLEWVTAIAAGYSHGLALKRDGTVVGWGNNSDGQTNSPPGLSNVVAIAAGGSHNLALKGDGTVVGWGRNYYGQATPPSWLTGVVAIAPGDDYSLALKSDGTVVGWGYGSGATPPAGLSNVVAIDAGDWHSLALKSDGTVVGWGDNYYGQAAPPAGLTGVVAISAGWYHSLALKSDGTVIGWGWNAYGQAAPPAGLTRVTAIAAGGRHSLALKSDGTVVAWGDNYYGQATPLTNLTGVVAIGAGAYHSLGLTLPCSLSAPSALTATSVATNQINLLWVDNSPDEVGFKIERAPDSGGAPGSWTQIVIVGTNVTTYSDTGLLPNTTYWYRVRAYNVSGDSDYSNLASAITPALTAPSGLAAMVVSTNQINLLWIDNSSNEDGFEIERATDSGGSPATWTQIATVGADVTNYSDIGLPPGTKYWYRVRAYNAEGTSGYSNRASAVTPALCPRLVVGWGNNSNGQASPPSGLEWVTAIAAGYDHSLALKSDGTVVGWGANYNGQATPPAGLSNVVAIAAGDGHSLALKSDGTVVAWSYAPTPPAGLSNVVAVSAGRYDDLALKSDGTVVGWGTLAPTPPAGLSNVVAIAAGSYLSLALKSDGTVVVWSGSPTPPAGLSNVVAISAGEFHCLALKRDGTVVSWGSSYTPPAGLSNVVAIAAGNSHDLALKSDGTVVGWGDNYYGQATPPAGLTRVTAIAAGGYHSLALTLPCSLSAPSALTATAISPSQINLSWLDNSGDEDGFKIERAASESGPWTQIAQVLRNTTNYRNTGLAPGATYYYRVRAYNSTGDSDLSNVAGASTPTLCPTSIVGWGLNNYGQGTALTNLADVVAIAGGYLHSLALKSDGTVVGWGLNNAGQATPPAGLTNVVTVSAGSYHSLALKSDGTVVGWGLNNYGQTNPPVGLSGVVTIAAGEQHSLALKSDGTVIGWGWNGNGQTNPPVGLSGVVAIAAGEQHSLALKSDGTVIGWGWNGNGQTNPPAGLRSVIAIAAGGSHSLALKSDGTVVGWGNNSYGQRTPPAGLTGVVAVMAGYRHSLALKSDGTVVGWGWNVYGQTNSPTGLTGVVAIAAGSRHNLAMLCAPIAPSILSATAVSSSQIDLNWTDNSNNEDRFGIERATSSTGPWTEIGSVDSNVTTYSDTGLSCGQTYYYRVRAYNAAGGSLYSNIANANTSTADTDGDGMTDCWMLQYFGHPTGQESDHSRATDDADGDGWTNLQEYQAGTDPSLPAPAAPSNLIATAVSTNQIDLSWADNASTEAGFKIERAPDDGGSPGTWTQIATVGTNVTTYTDTGLAPNRTYWYRVLAYSPGGISGSSNQANATTPCAPFDPTVVTTQPCSQVVCAGEMATFSVVATGSSLTYQWRKEGRDLVDGDGISGANTATLTISNALPGWGRVCDTVLGTASVGKAFGSVVAGQTYSYQASGCVSFVTNNDYHDPDGTGSTNACASFDIPGMATGGIPPFTCPGLTNLSLVGKVEGTCIQLGKSGSFVAPASGTLTLYCNDQVFWDNGGSWRVCVGSGSEGIYDVVVTGVCGSQVSSGAVLTVNSTPGCMTLAVAAPPDYGYTTNSSVTVTGTASASAGLAGVTVNLAGATSANGYTNWTASVSGLAVGTNTLTVIATDNAVPAHTLTNFWHVIYDGGTFDGNGDGLPDAWQVQYFGSVNSPDAAPTADPDGDGQINMAEFLAGTDPTNSGSALRIIGVTQEGDDVRVTWTTAGGRTNAVQATAGDVEGGYTSAFTDLFIVTNTVGTVTNYLDAGGATNSPARYYRVRLVP